MYLYLSKNFPTSNALMFEKYDAKGLGGFPHILISYSLLMQWLSDHSNLIFS